MTRKKKKKAKPSVKATGQLAKQLPKLVVQPNGKGALLSGGIPGHKGGTGRPPDAWKAMCQELASSDAVVEKAKKVIEDPDHPAWLGAWKFLADHGYGKPKESIEHSASESLVGLLAGSFK